MTRAEYILRIAEGKMDRLADKVGDKVGAPHIGKQTGRGMHKVLRGGHALSSYGGSLVDRGIVKGVTRVRHGAGQHMKDYRAKKKDIKKNTKMFSQDRSQKLDDLEHKTLGKLQKHVADRRAAKGKEARSDRSSARTAKRILYGTPFGTRTF